MIDQLIYVWEMLIAGFRVVVEHFLGYIIYGALLFGAMLLAYLMHKTYKRRQ